MNRRKAIQLITAALTLPFLRGTKEAVQTSMGGWVRTPSGWEWFSASVPGGMTDDEMRAAAELLVSRGQLPSGATVKFFSLDGERLPDRTLANNRLF